MALFLIYPHIGYSASCCSGGQGASRFLTNGELYEWSLSQKYQRSIGRTNREGEALFDYRTRDEVYTTSITGTKMIVDQWQIGGGFGVVHKEIEKRSKENKSALSDLSIWGGKEIYEGTFRFPRVFSALRLGVPIGKSVYNAQERYFVDATSAGLYQLTWTLMLVKLSFSTSIEVQQNFGRNFEEKKVESFQSYLFQVGHRYEWSQNVSSILSLVWHYKNPVQVYYKNPTRLEESSHEYYWDLSLKASYAFTSDWSSGIQYTDSTLIGKSVSSNLARSALVELKYTY